jgi:hypothetical protein
VAVERVGSGSFAGLVGEGGGGMVFGGGYMVFKEDRKLKWNGVFDIGLQRFWTWGVG